MAKASTWIPITTLVFMWLLISSASATTDASNDKDRELGEAQADIKALKLSEPLREKAVEELSEELPKVEEKLKLTESTLESKNLEIKEINYEKKASMAAQFAEETPLRRVHAAQKDDGMPPIEAIHAPQEAELKLAQQVIAKLQDDKALDRTKSKEVALLEAERTDAFDDNNRELGKAQADIKALRVSEPLREKAVEELSEELPKVEEKLKLTESTLESKNLEIKEINYEKRASMAAQFAEEAPLRRVHAAQKDDGMPPIEEAELKLARQQIAKLQGDNKALNCLTKSKETALLEAERTDSSDGAIPTDNHVVLSQDTPPHHIMDMPPCLKRSNSMSWLDPWICYMYSLMVHVAELVLECVVNHLDQNHGFNLFPIIFRIFVLVLSSVSGGLLYISPPHNPLIRCLQIGLTLYALVYGVVATALVAMGETVYEPLESIAIYLSFASVLVHVMEGLSEWLRRRKEPHGHRE